MGAVRLDTKAVRALPKVVLHDHLDGGLRPETLVALARSCGYEGVGRDPGRVAALITAQADAKSLAGYLEAFAHTIAVMQTPEALFKVAYDAVEDLCADGVVYAELRFAPELHLGSLDEATEAVLAGLAAASEDTGTFAALVLSAIRTSDRAVEVAQTACWYANLGVVGFDIAGDERSGLTPEHKAAVETAVRGDIGVTLHAGESTDAAAAIEALEAGATRIGHGVRIADDQHAVRAVAESGALLELCPTSNVHTGVVPSIAEHPAGMFFRSGVRFSVSCDNRLMSATTTSEELAVLAAAFGWDEVAIGRIQRDTLDAAFCPPAIKERIRCDLLDRAY